MEKLATMRVEYMKKIAELEKNGIHTDNVVQRINEKINGKAGREAVVKGQNKFMNDLGKKEGEMDENIKKMIQEEFMKLGNKYKDY